MKVLKHISKTASSDKAGRVEVIFAFECVLEKKIQESCQKCLKNLCCFGCPFYVSEAMSCFVAQASFEALPKEALKTDVTRRKDLESDSIKVSVWDTNQNKRRIYERLFVV